MSRRPVTLADYLNRAAARVTAAWLGCAIGAVIVFELGWTGFDR